MNDVSDYRWVEGVPLSGFSNKALIIVQRFSRVLRQVSDRTLTLQDPMLGRNIVREIDSNDDPRLRSVFDSLLEELSKLAANRELPRYRGSVDLHTEEVSKSTQTTYRGAIVNEPSKSSKDSVENSETTPSKKKRMYRGVEI